MNTRWVFVEPSDGIPHRASTMSLVRGRIMLEWPEAISPDDWPDIEAWVALTLRSMRRFVKDAAPTPSAEPERPVVITRLLDGSAP